MSLTILDPHLPKTIDAPSEQAAADALAGRICAAAAVAAQTDCELLELIGEFDATGALRWWVEFTSVAHWLSWACSMSPGVAREHVRVRRALQRMPTVLGLFREGRLSYSKVREVTRIVDLIDEAKVADLALAATASQLARMISAFRAGARGTRLRQELAEAGHVLNVAEALFPLTLQLVGLAGAAAGVDDLRLRVPGLGAAFEP
jgi:Domain of unknown function (DUF222)